MYKISNDVMLKFFQANNESRFLYTCTDIVKAGDANHIIKKIEFYTAEENRPSLEYISFSEDVDNGLSVYIGTDSFIDSVCAKILENYSLYGKVRINTSNADFAENDVILKYFDISDIIVSANGDNSVYALLSNEKPPTLILPDKAEILRVSAEQLERLKNLDDGEWGGLSRLLNGGFKHYISESVFLFLLYHGGNLAGYLDANCRYKNFYDIAYIFVHEDFRGKGFGVLLTTYFAHYCLNNGFVPHYGTSVSKYSADAAIRSGFEEVERLHGFVCRKKS